MSYIRDRVIVLKKEPFRDHDRRYVLFGREHGLIIAVARGSSRLQSKQAGHLEPFLEADVMVAPGKAFDHIAVARAVPQNECPPLERLGAFAVMGGLSDLVIALTRQGASDPHVFQLLREMRSACIAFPSEPTPERARFLLAAGTLKLLDEIGFAPSVEDSRLPDQAKTLLKFIRLFPLADALRVTAPVDLFQIVADFIEDGLRQTPLNEEPHGARTIHALMS